MADIEFVQVGNGADFGDVDVIDAVPGVDHELKLVRQRSCAPEPLAVPTLTPTAAAPASPTAPVNTATALAVGFTGLLLIAITTTGARSPVNAVLGRGPLAFYGRISYGVYMTHIAVFIYFGWFDRRMDSYGNAGNLAVVAFRLAVTTVVATVLWYGFESRILKLKRYF